MLLSNTSAGKTWLAQFDDSDRDLAALLLNSLRLISSEEIEHSIQRLLESMVADRGPIALYAAREIKDDEVYFQDKRSRPTHVPKNQQAGSEGRFAHMIRTLAGVTPKVFFDHPPLATIKKNRIRNIVIIDDISYTGNRIATFINGFMRHRTLASWASAGFIELTVATYALARNVENTLRTTLERTKRDHFKVWPKLVTHERLTRDSTLRYWRAVEEHLKTLLTKYGERAQINPDYHHGYGKALATVIPAYRCPNNAPGILWYSTPKWRPLFPGRNIPVNLRRFFTHTFDRRSSLVQLLAASPSLLPHFEKSSAARKVQLLDLLRQGYRRVHLLAQMCDISHVYVRRLLSRMRDEGLTLSSLDLTTQGLDLLKTFQNDRIITPDAAQASRKRQLLQEFYFPRALRLTPRTI